jgi:hypothetical protein
MTRKTFLMPVFFTTGATIVSFYILLHSIDKGETWRISAALAGFLAFLFLNIVFLRRLFRSR